MCCDETAEYSVCDGWPRTEVLAAGNFGDWHAAVGEVPSSSVPKTPM